MYTAEEILRTLISHINDRLLAISDDGDGGVKLIEKFWKTVPNFYIDPKSSFVHFKAMPETTSSHPFQAAFLENIKEGVLPHPKKDISDFLLRSMYIWVGALNLRASDSWSVALSN